MRRRSRFTTCLRGFTLVELLVTVALVGIAASAVLPLASLMEQRAKETQLRHALRTIREALDNYKVAADSGLIAKTTGSSGYPASLQVLVTGVPRSASFGLNSPPVVFLRSIPRDPFYKDRQAPADQTWNTRAYGAPPGQFEPGADVYDISSKSDGVALDGTRLGDW